MLLYLHIPFCDSKCHYCAFNSYTSLHDRRNAYMQALFAQLRHDIGAEEIKPGEIETVFVGGGTPSTVAATGYEAIFAYLQPYLREGAEITFEANPNSATKAWLEVIKNLGATRISFGVQSFDDRKLKLLGRAHTRDDALRAVFDAQAAGFGHISIDLIYSTPFDDKVFLQKEFEVIKTLPIDHLSLYSLTIEEATKFAATPELQHERDEIYPFIVAQCEALGLHQYEVSNFGRYRSRHNVGYWEYKPYLGIGAGAVGCVENRRTYPHNAIDAYIKDPLYKSYETLSEADVKTEKILLGLRYFGGFSPKLLEHKEKAKLEVLLKEGTVRIEKGHVVCKNLFLADEIALFLTT